MTTTTLTAELAAGDLLAELRRIEELLDGVGTFDVLRARLDELTAALRRTRGRIARLDRQAKPKSDPKPAPGPKPVEAKPEPVPAVPNTAAASAKPAEAKPAAELVMPKPAPAEREPAPSVVLARVSQGARHVTAARFMVAALAVTVTALWGRARRTVTRGLRALVSTVRRARLTRAERQDEPREAVSIR